MKRSYVIATLLAVLVGGWILSGQIDLLTGTGPTSAASDIPPKPATVTAPIAGSGPIAVRARWLNASPRTVEIVARGRTEMVRSVELKAEIAGRVIAIEAEKGARVKTGDEIVRLSVEERAARLAESEALMRQRKLEYEAAKQLAAKGFRAETSLAESAALLDAAKARLKQMEVEMAKLTIRAPFDGIIETRAAELGDYLKDGDRVATIVDEDPFLVVAQVSERDIGRLHVGDRGTASLVTGQKVEGHIRYIATTADSATRTFRIELEVRNPDHALRDGITAEIRVATKIVPAHFVSPAVLTLDERGAVGVRIVMEDETVAFAPVSIIGDGVDGVWIAGLPEKALVITVGQESVRAGDKVRAVIEKAAS